MLFPCPPPPLSAPCGQMNGRAGNREEHLLLYPRLWERVRETRLYRLSARLNWGRKCVHTAPDLWRLASSSEEVAVAGHSPLLGPGQVSGLFPTLPASQGLTHPQQAVGPAGLCLPADPLGSLAWKSIRAHSLPPSLGPGRVPATLCQERPQGLFALRGMTGWPRRSC